MFPSQKAALTRRDALSRSWRTRDRFFAGFSPGIYEKLVAVISAKCIINGGPNRLHRKMLKFELPLGAVASGTSDFVAPGPVRAFRDRSADRLCYRSSRETPIPKWLTNRAVSLERTDFSNEPVDPSSADIAIRGIILSFRVSIATVSRNIERN